MSVKKTKEKPVKQGKPAAPAKNTESGKEKNVPAERVKKPRVKLPVRLVLATVFGVLFLLLLASWIAPDGPVQKAFADFVKGLFGKTVYYVSIPACLFLTYIFFFSGKRPVLMRSVCVGVFVLCCGGIAQVYLQAPASTAFQWVADMYTGGIAGSTAGLICGSLSIAFLAMFHEVMTLIIFITTAVLTLLGSFQITIPSIARAIQNRPRGEWEQDKEEAQEPAVLVVNHIANKRIAHKEMKMRQRELEELEELEVVRQEPQPVKSRKKVSPKAEELPPQIVQEERPVFEPARRPIQLPEDDSIFTPVAVPKRELTENIPEVMPLLDMDDIPTTAAEAAEVKKKVTAKEAAEAEAQVAQEIAENEAEPKQEYRFPPIDLLKSSGGSSGDGTAEMRENSKRLNETLASFKIEAHIINVTRGPSVTRYEVELDKGVRLNKLTTIADDIALSLGASGVRIAAVPGRISVVGIEVPNRAVTTVSLRDVIDSPTFADAKSKTSFAVGKDIGGNCIVGNIAKLPHMLIAGTTGSGKSVCMNSIIISLLYKASPDDVKLIMIDPKMVELGIYNSIPHLLIPVVTDPKKAAGSLQWAVTEMMRRYKAMSDVGVRDLAAYNEAVESSGEGKRLPQVVVIIDELADLMLVAAKEVEESICRIAQMGRASGIHLVIATQRPSADVITGLMKANIPSRIAFAVASAMESRIILDTMGAEKLVGKGDMLFSPIGSGKPQRVQGCFVSDPEVEAVATFVKENFNSDYDDDIVADIEKRAAQTGSGKSAPATADQPEPNDGELDGDEMLPAAVDVILETNQASVSMLQRRLKLGYARAARIVDEMEEKGIVGPFQGSKPRAILVTKEQWEAMKGGSQPTQMEFEDIPFEEEEFESTEE